MFDSHHVPARTGHHKVLYNDTQLEMHYVNYNVSTDFGGVGSDPIPYIHHTFNLRLRHSYYNFKNIKNKNFNRSIEGRNPFEHLLGYFVVCPMVDVSSNIANKIKRLNKHEMRTYFK